MALSAASALRVTARAWRLLLLVAVIGALGGWGVATALPSRYRATAYLLGTTAGRDPIASTLLIGESTVYARLATDPNIIGPALRQAAIPIDPVHLGRYVSAAADPNSPLLAITATTGNRARSAQLANVVGQRVAQYSGTFANDTGYGLSVLAGAVPPAGAVGPGAKTLALAGAIVLLLLTMSALVVRADYRAAGTGRPEPVTKRPRSRVIRHRWKLVAVATLIGVGAGFATATVREPTYRATAYLIGVRSSLSPIDSSLLIGESKAFARVVDDPSVVGAALDRAGGHIAPNQLRTRVVPSTDANDPVLKITVSAHHATEAAVLANAVATSVSAYSKALTAKTGYQLNAFEQALPPTSPNGPGRAVLAALWGATGALVGLAIVFVVFGADEDDARAAPASGEECEPGDVPPDAVAHDLGLSGAAAGAPSVHPVLVLTTDPRGAGRRGERGARAHGPRR